MHIRRHALLSPGRSAWDDLGNEKVENPESTTKEAFYTTDAFTDYGIRFIREHRRGNDTRRPFFLYLAYTAPHWPLQAFEDDIAKYRGKYRAGWEQLREQRHQRQVKSGLIDPEMETLGTDGKDPGMGFSQRGEAG